MNRPFLLGLLTYVILAVALCLLFLSFMGTAQAESFTLHRSGAWQVSYEASDNDSGVTWCEAINANSEEGFMLQLIAWGSGNTSLALYDAKAMWAEKSKIVVKIDRKAPWEADANSMGQTLFIDNPKKEFLQEIYLGKIVYVDINYDLQWDYWFSLDGSAEAIRALADCKNKLGSKAS